MPGRPVHILHIEDSQADAELVRLALGERGLPHVLEHQPDGEEALRRLRDAGAPRPDLVLLDLNLPALSGHEILASIKADPALRAMPVLVLSTSAAPADVDAAYSAHANSYLRKPVDFLELVELMGRIERFWLETALLPAG